MVTPMGTSDSWTKIVMGRPRTDNNGVEGAEEVEAKKLKPLWGYIQCVEQHSEVARASSCSNVAYKQRILQFQMNSQVKQTIEPSPAGEPILDNPLQGTMPATNADNHFATEMGMAVTSEEAPVWPELRSRQWWRRKKRRLMLNIWPRSEAFLSSWDYKLYPTWRCISIPEVLMEGTCGAFPPFYVSILQGS